MHLKSFWLNFKWQCIEWSWRESEFKLNSNFLFHSEHCFLNPTPTPNMRFPYAHFTLRIKKRIVVVLSVCHQTRPETESQPRHRFNNTLREELEQSGAWGSSKESTEEQEEQSCLGWLSYQTVIIICRQESGWGIRMGRRKWFCVISFISSCFFSFFLFNW